MSQTQALPAAEPQRGHQGFPALGDPVGNRGGGTWPAGRGRSPSLTHPHHRISPLDSLATHWEGGTEVQPVCFLQWLGRLPLAAADVAVNNFIRNLSFFAPFPSLWPAFGQELPELAAQKISGRARLLAGISQQIAQLDGFGSRRRNS